MIIARHLMDIAEAIDAFANQRIVITGGPRTGKTTLADMLSVAEILRCDDLIDEFEWSALSLEVAHRFDLHAPWLVEGVAGVRALRKWLGMHDEGKPCDLMVYLSVPVVDTLKPGQVTMGKGCATIFNDIQAELLARGVTVIEGPDL